MNKDPQNNKEVNVIAYSNSNGGGEMKIYVPHQPILSHRIMVSLIRSRSKHNMNMKYYAIHESIDEKEISISEDKYADASTTALTWTINAQVN